MSAETKEQLEIQAKLDTSQLKKDAQQGMQTVVNEEKKVENQSKQTSKAIDSIADAGKKAGASLQSAGQSGTQALKQVGNEADKTADKISNISDIAKNMKLGTAIGLASRFANSGIGKGLGNSIGGSLGMSDDDMNVAGSMISGGLGGASVGAMIAGPLGAAVGGLVGAGAGLVQAGLELRQAAAEQLLASRERMKHEEKAAQGTISGYRRYTAGLDLEQYEKNMMGMSKEELESRLPKLEKMRDDNEAEITKKRKQIDDFVKTMEETPGMMNADWATKLAEMQQELEDMVFARKTYESFIGKAQGRISYFNNLPVGPELPPEVKAQRDAEERKRQEDEKRAKDLEKAKDMSLKKKQQDLVKEYQSQISEEEAFRGKLSGMKLTDSLTRMGGGSGYGVQMQGINSYVKNISTNIAGIKNVMQRCLDVIQSIDNKYSPYGGQFISESE